MKIVYYCQNIWGIGHLFRSLEIIKALSRHEVILVTGGKLVDIPLPLHVREIHLPGIFMDRDNKKLLPTEAGLSYVEAKKRRMTQFFDVFAKEAPDLFIIELYPFGRNAFRFELDPVLKAIRNKDLLPCKVICSLRDILVEKRDQIEFEERVIKRLNRSFDAVLIHSDPNLVKLNDFFSRISDIKPLIHYTGFVSAELPPLSREAIRKELRRTTKQKVEAHEITRLLRETVVRPECLEDK